jgi:hypothetical protein
MSKMHKKNFNKHKLLHWPSETINNMFEKLKINKRTVPLLPLLIKKERLSPLLIWNESIICK